MEKSEKSNYLHTKKKNEDNCPICKESLRLTDEISNRFGLVDEDNNVAEKVNREIVEIHEICTFEQENILKKSIEASENSTTRRDVQQQQQQQQQWGEWRGSRGQACGWTMPKLCGSSYRPPPGTSSQ